MRLNSAWFIKLIINKLLKIILKKGVKINKKNDEITEVLLECKKSETKT